MRSICLIFDNSGSMRENGTDYVVKMMILSIAAQIPNGAAVTAWKWNQTVQETPFSPDRPQIDLDFAGRSDPETLADFLSHVQDSAVLLISDDIPTRRLRDAVVKAGAYCILTGRNAFPSDLERALGFQRLFAPSDCAACIHELLQEKGLQEL